MTTTHISTGPLLSLSALSRELSTTRETLRKRLAAVGVQPAGHRGGYPAFRLRAVLQAWMGCPESGFDPDRLDPFKRRAYYQGEHEKLKLQLERRELIPRIEAEQEMASIVKITAECFDTLPDVMERDCGLTPDTLSRMEAHLDKVREELYKRLIEEDETEEEHRC